MKGWRSGTMEESALHKAGGEVLPDGTGIRLKGWLIQSKKAPISGDKEIEALKQEVGGVLAVPEQLFGGSFLRLTHEASGTVLSFTAAAALHAWATEGRSAVRVGAARNWLATREKELQASGTKILDYDWTYSTSYAGTVTGSAGQPISEGWQEARAPLNRSILLVRDPILYYDEVPLYVSELDDNGISELSVKVRVMPGCWYVLLRFWLRVDGVLVRLAETRVLCQFAAPAADAGGGIGAASPTAGQALITREIRVSEGTFEELRAGGAPPAGAAYADADSAAAALQAVAPVGVTQYVTQELSL